MCYNYTQVSSYDCISRILIVGGFDQPYLRNILFRFILLPIIIKASVFTEVFDLRLATLYYKILVSGRVMRCSHNLIPCDLGFDSRHVHNRNRSF